MFAVQDRVQVARDVARERFGQWAVTGGSSGLGARLEAFVLWHGYGEAPPAALLAAAGPPDLPPAPPAAPTSSRKRKRDQLD